jgi:hypothetical protein
MRRRSQTATREGRVAAPTMRRRQRAASFVQGKGRGREGVGVGVRLERKLVLGVLALGG